MARADVVILGGGIIGTSLADEFARQNQQVVVIERGKIGAEASSAAAGILSAQMDVPRPGHFFDFCQLSRRMYAKWVSRLERHSGQEAGFKRSGVLYLAASKAQESRMQSRASWQGRLGLRVEHWSAQQIRRREPAVDGNFRCGFNFPLEGQVDNVLLMRALAGTCLKDGVTLKEETAAQRLVIRNNTVTGVETSHGHWDSPVVINTIGSWASINPFPVKLPVEPARGQIVSFAGPKKLFRRPIMSERAYIVQREDGQLLLGSTIERAGFNKSLTVKGIRDILCGARTISSRLDSCAFVDSWAGLRPYSKTGFPLLGPTEIRGVFVATGHFRHGILLAPATALLMAQLVLHGHSSFDLSPFFPEK